MALTLVDTGYDNQTWVSKVSSPCKAIVQAGKKLLKTPLVVYMFLAMSPQ